MIVTVSGTGIVSTANNSLVSTNVGGVVTKVYRSDGDIVKSGDPIIEFDLDQVSKQKHMQALASYQSAKNNLELAKATNYSLQADMFSKWDTFKKLSESDNYKDPASVNRNLPEFHIPEKEWLATEAKYKNQQNVITQAQTALSSAWLSYQQSSPIVYAPISGVVNGLSLQTGSVVTSQDTSQKIASVITNTTPTVTINLTEIDIPKIKIGNLATLTFDALTGKTYTGKIISIDTIGTVSSGVINYPTIIMLDNNLPEILPNMSASANIITQSKNDVLLLPTGAIQNQNGQTTVRVLRNGQVEQIAVEVGISSDTQIEITSGLSEGDTVVTSTTSTASQLNSQTQSPFSAFGNRSFGGGAVIRR